MSNEAKTTEAQRREWVEDQMLPPLLQPLNNELGMPTPHPPLGGAVQTPASLKKHNHYFKDVRTLEFIDVYRVLHLFNVTDPCLQHAVKKLLVAGGRGAGKDIRKDVSEAQDSLARFLEMRDEETEHLLK